MNTVHNGRRQFAVSDLHPEVQTAFLKLTHDLVRAYETKRTKARFQPFEGYRSAVRQKHLLAEGTTKARPWHSAHQFGLAVDFVNHTDSGWDWSTNTIDFDELHKLARASGLIAGHIPWDPGHVEHPLWLELRKQLK